MLQLKRWFIAAGCVGAVVVPGTAQAATVPNGAFDKATAGKLDCWEATGATATLALVAGRSDSAAPQVRGRATVADSVEWGLSRASTTCGISVTAGRSYTIGAWYQATSMVRPSVYAYGKSTGWTKWFTGAPYAGSTPWDRIETTTPPVPAGTQKMAMAFAVDGNAKLVIDDVTVADATSQLQKPNAPAEPFTTSFPESATLVTSEYAVNNPTRTDAARSSVWTVTSGSLFASAGNGDTGQIDAGRPNATSSNFTDSSVFRMNTVRADFKNVTVSFNLNVQEIGSTPRTPAVAYDGVHIWLRHKSQYYLYAASVARRDGKVVIKKKCPGGPSNDGTYYTLGKEIPAAVPVTPGQWTKVSASVQNNPSGSVTIILSVGGQQLISAVDTGVGCAPIKAGAAVGVRGDNTRFQFNSFTATAL